MDEVVDYCVLMKTSHKCFCLATLEKLIKDPVVSYLVMKRNPKVPGGGTLMAIGLK